MKPFPPSLLCALALILVPGCALRPLRGGHAVTTGAGLAQSLTQSQNPSQASRQSQETIKVRTYTLPAGTQFGSPSYPPSSTSLPRPPQGGEAGGEGEPHRSRPS